MKMTTWLSGILQKHDATKKYLLRLFQSFRKGFFPLNILSFYIVFQPKQTWPRRDQLQVLRRRIRAVLLRQRDGALPESAGSPRGERRPHPRLPWSHWHQHHRPGQAQVRRDRHVVRHRKLKGAGRHQSNSTGEHWKRKQEGIVFALELTIFVKKYSTKIEVTLQIKNRCFGKPTVDSFLNLEYT